MGVRWMTPRRGSRAWTSDGPGAFVVQFAANLGPSFADVFLSRFWTGSARLSAARKMQHFQPLTSWSYFWRNSIPSAVPRMVSYATWWPTLWVRT